MPATTPTDAQLAARLKADPHHLRVLQADVERAYAEVRWTGGEGHPPVKAITDTQADFAAKRMAIAPSARFASDTDRPPEITLALAKLAIAEASALRALASPPKPRSVRDMTNKEYRTALSEMEREDARRRIAVEDARDFENIKARAEQRAKGNKR